MEGKGFSAADWRKHPASNVPTAEMPARRDPHRPNTDSYYTWHDQRISHATLSYRQTGDKEWTKLHQAYDEETRDAALYSFVKNVQHISLNGDISLGQWVADYRGAKPSRQGKAAAGDWYRWRVTFAAAAIRDVFVKETEFSGARKGSSIEIRFTSDKPPMSYDDSRMVEPETDKAGGKGKEVEKVEADEEEEATQEANAAELPLARLFNRSDLEFPMEFRLEFWRSKGTNKNSFYWSWQAAIAFLAGRTKWVPLQKKEESFRLDKMTLDEFAKHGHGVANLKYIEEFGGWAIMPKRNLSQASTSKVPPAIPPFNSSPPALTQGQGQRSAEEPASETIESKQSRLGDCEKKKKEQQALAVKVHRLKVARDVAIQEYDEAVEELSESFRRSLN